MPPFSFFDSCLAKGLLGGPGLLELDHHCICSPNSVTWAILLQELVGGVYLQLCRVITTLDLQVGGPRVQLLLPLMGGCQSPSCIAKDSCSRVFLGPTTIPILIP